MTTIDPNLTEFEPTIVADRVTGTDTLAILVNHGAVLGRLLFAIVLNANDARCNYPGANWFHGVDTTGSTCVDVYSSSIPWSIASTVCGLSQTSNDTTVTFTGSAVVQYNDALPLLDGTVVPPRNVSSVVQFSVEQPTMLLNVGSHVEVFNDPTLLSAVAHQHFNLLSGNASLVLLISTRAPLLTDSVSFAGVPSGISIAQIGSADNDDCPNSNTTTCQQAYTFTLKPTQCTLNGTFLFSFNIVCQPIVEMSQCPTGGATTSLSVSVTLSSTNLCTLSRQRLQVGGSLESFESFNNVTFSFGAAKTTFFQGQAENFRVVLNSTNGFPFASSAITSIVIDNVLGTPITLYNKAATTDALFLFAQHNSSASGATTHYHHFVFTPASTPFGGNVSRTQSILSNIVANIEMTFANGARKRAVYQLQSNEVVNAQYSNQVSIASDPVTATVSPTQPLLVAGTSTLSTSITLMLVATVLSILV